jgi:tyrosyl-tRNA synthetase
MEEKIQEVLTRSIDTIYPNREALEKLLKSGKKLRIYMGIDPTATYVHLGHATNYIILKRFHELGHKIIALVGDFTAMIGDPSDKSSARKRLSREQVYENLQSFKEQIGKIIDFNNKENPVELRFNSRWLSKMSFEDVINLAAHFTVQQMIERDVFQKRIKQKKPLYVNEFFYPLMQGYDSVVLEADVEVGGTDQTFNMLAGRQLVKELQNREKIVVSTTLLENPVTREKLMSKSLGTGIALNEKPNEMFGKVMALPDEAIIQCFVDCTYVNLGTIKQYEGEISEGRNPRDIKMLLAKEIVGMYHSEKDTRVAQDHFVNVFQKKELPSEIKEIEITGNLLVPNLLVQTGLTSSGSEARRLINSGAVEIDGAKITEISATIATHPGMIIKVGKRRFAKIK